MAEELSRERNYSKLNIDQLTKILWNGENQVERRRNIEKLALSDPVFSKNNYYFLTTEEKYVSDIKKHTHAIKLAGDLKLSQLEISYLSRVIFNGNPLPMQKSMFIPTIIGQCNDEQQKKWLGLAEDYKMLGCYAQTELGHGTFVRGLETTATYDPNTEEWDMHTPTLTSIKWWPGSMANNANYAIVIARLITRGIDYGTHPFMVQLRSLKDHRPLKGVILGDIGPKLGFSSLDNGYLKLNHVRIPRDNLLMKFVNVSKEGIYSRKVSTKVSYGPMVFVRASLARGSFDVLSRAVTISVRYSVVRRQTQNKASQLETQLLDYVNQQYKLLPLIAICYALHFASNFILEFYSQAAREFVNQNLGQLPELHATTSGIKSLATTLAVEGIEVCRIACGGHGYSMSSGLPSLFQRWAPTTTLEGDNTVLYLQTARYLIKKFNELQMYATKEELPWNIKYLQRNFIPQPIGSDLHDTNNQLAIYELTARKCVNMAALKIRDGEESGLDEFDSRNMSAIELIQAAKIHSYYTILQIFIDNVNNLRNNITDANFRILKKLSQLFALHTILEHSGPFLESNTIQPSQLIEVRNAVQSLLSEIRPEAVPLVDAFDHHDEVLESVLGRKDGKVYEALWEWVKLNPRNSYKNNVHPVYNKYLKKVIKSKL